MSAAAIVINRLLAANGVTSIVNNRVYPVAPPQGTPPPAIVVHLVSTADVGRTIGAAGDYFRSVVQIDSLSAKEPSGDPSQAIVLGEAVILALNGITKQTVAGCDDVDILLNDGSDFTEFDDLSQTYRRVTRFTVFWRRGS